MHVIRSVFIFGLLAGCFFGLDAAVSRGGTARVAWAIGSLVCITGVGYLMSWSWRADYSRGGHQGADPGHGPATGTATVVRPGRGP